MHIEVRLNTPLVLIQMWRQCNPIMLDYIFAKSLGIYAKPIGDDGKV
jgi:hypothetical protein